MDIFKYLPMEVIQIIIKYDGKIKYRNGVFVNQIMKNDHRYKLLLNVPRIITHSLDNYYRTQNGTIISGKSAYVIFPSPSFYSTILVEPTDLYIDPRCTDMLHQVLIRGQFFTGCHKYVLY